MFELSWSGVLDCFYTVREPKPRSDAARSIAKRGGISVRLAEAFLDIAVELNLAFVDPKGHVALSAHVEQPEELLKASTLIRLFRAWQQLGPSDPLRMLHDPEMYFCILGVKTIYLLRSANELARYARDIHYDLSPQPTVLLEMVRLWYERHDSSPQKPLFSAPDAYAAFHGLLFKSGIYHDDESGAVDRFLRACRVLNNRNLVRLAIVQYPFERNKPYHRFRTDLGYIKALYQPKAFEGLTYAKPVQKIRKRISSAH